MITATPPSALLARLLADSTDRIGWLKARSFGITATDAAKLSSENAIDKAVYDKAYGTGFSGNAYTEHGKTREPVIAQWVYNEFGICHSSGLFHADGNRRHLATPDGLTTGTEAPLLLAEIKTSSKPITSVPRTYLRQIWWQQYVMGAEKTLLVWEQHSNFVPVSAVPEIRWIERDEAEVSKLVSLADRVLEKLDRIPAPEYY